MAKIFMAECPSCGSDDITKRVYKTTLEEYECQKCNRVWRYRHLSNKGKEFEAFSKEVLNHIETYAVPQYGDYPSDLIKETTIDDIVHDMMRYLSRMKTNARGQKEIERDCLKLAHYSCILSNKVKGVDNE